MVLGVCFLSEVPGLLKIENLLRLYGENGKKGSSDADSQSRDPSQFQVPLPFLGYEAQGDLKNAIPANLRRSQALAYFWGLVGVDPSKL